MIDLEDYRKWLIKNYFLEKTPDNIILCMSQGLEVPYKFLALGNTKTAKRYIEQFLHTTPKDKNSRVSINRYFLFNYGYKQCRSCCITKELKYFHSLVSRVDGKQIMCTSCRQTEDSARYTNNIEYYAEVRKNRYEDNKNEEIIKVREWQNSNRGLVNAVAAKRRASKKNATPKWLTIEQNLEIKQLYTLARQMSIDSNIEYHVDHIIPLVNDNVCGLHVPWNLQILTSTENMSKGNRCNGI